MPYRFSSSPVPEENLSGQLAKIISTDKQSGSCHQTNSAKVLRKLSDYKTSSGCTNKKQSLRKNSLSQLL